jgi:hypothetical protein
MANNEQGITYKNIVGLLKSPYAPHASLVLLGIHVQT